MKKVYQTIIDPNHGNCMQAVVASLFEMELDEVPNFIEFEDRWYLEMIKFYEERGYELGTISGSTEHMKIAAEFDGGVNGYFDATVESKLFPGRTHAVVVDKNLNIVHDPNPSGVYLSCRPEDVIAIQCVTKFISGKTGKCFTYEEWDNLSEEERDANTYKIGESIN